MRVLALDYGSARCGCALSDPTGTIVTPIDVVERAGTKRGLARVRELAVEREVQLVVVGLPLSLQGEDTDQTRETRDFARRGAPARELAGGSFALGSLVLARGDRSREGRERTAEERERDREERARQRALRAAAAPLAEAGLPPYEPPAEDAAVEPDRAPALHDDHHEHPSAHDHAPDPAPAAEDPYADHAPASDPGHEHPGPELTPAEPEHGEPAGDQHHAAEEAAAEYAAHGQEATASQYHAAEEAAAEYAPHEQEATASQYHAAEEAAAEYAPHDQEATASQYVAAEGAAAADHVPHE